MIIHNDPYGMVHCGDCLDPDYAREVMGDLRADALIFDAPYSSKTHDGHKGGLLTAQRGASFAVRARAAGKDSPEIRYALRHGASVMRRDIEYEAFDANKIAAFCAAWLPLARGWVVSITDDTLAPLWAAEFERAGLYAFSGLPLVELGSRVRVSGDGPSCWSCWIVVARPRRAPYTKWGTLPGAYVQGRESKKVVGGKPLRSMLSIVSDYSRAGDLCVDPFVGGGTTIAAAKTLGRRYIGIDRLEYHARLSAKRVAATHEQIRLFEAGPQRNEAEQVPLFGGEYEAP